MKKRIISEFIVMAILFTMFLVPPMSVNAAVEGDWTYTLYDGDTTAAITGYSGTDTNVIIPSVIAGKPVTRIGSNAFIDKGLITEVTVPSSVLRIESSAFQNCSVSTINLTEGLAYIGQFAFNGTNISSVSIPNSVTHIDNNAFAMNRNLTSVTIIGNNLATLGNGAFSITGISTFRIPTSLTTIPDWAFNDTYLSSLTIPSNIASIGYVAFGNNPNLNAVLFEGNAPTMGNFVFSIPSSGFTIYYYTGAVGFTTPTWTAGSVEYNTIELDAPNLDVCQIGSTGYENLSDALAAAVDGDTITLLKDIEYGEKITITGKELTFNLSGYTLNINNAAGTALEVGSGGTLNLSGEGALNVYGNEFNGYGVYAHDGGEASVTNASTSGYSAFAAYAKSGGIIHVNGDATGTATGLGVNTYCRGAQADDAGSVIYVDGNVSSANNFGAVAQLAGTVMVGGDVAGHYGGAYVDNGSIHIDGNVTGIDQGAYALSGGTISVGGNAIATGSGGSGAYAVQVGTTITVAGDAVSLAQFGRGASAADGAVVDIDGDAISAGDDGYGVFSAYEDALIIVGGNIFAENGTGVWARQAGSVLVDCEISALYYLKLEDLVYDYEDNLEVTTKEGYLTYSDGTNTVWVAAVPPADRISGSNRYSTAIGVSQSGWDQSDVVLLARGDNYADALAGVPLAYQLDAPILLSSTSQIGTATLDEIDRLGATHVIILGGTSAISDDVKLVLEGEGLTVERIAGTNRYHTAVLIAEYMRAEGASFDKAFITVGTNFPDALAAASYAAIRGEPILLTGTNTLSQLTKDAMDSLGIVNTFIIGGTSVVSEAVATELALYGHYNRISGSNRYSTAVEIASYFDVDTGHYYIATGLNFPDAITGAVLAAKNKTGVLLVQGTLSEPNTVVKEYLLLEQIGRVTLFGGTSVISDSIQNWFIDNL